MKLLKNKKAFNDVVIIAISLSILLFTSVFIPSINASFGTSADVYDVDGNLQDVRNDADSISNLSAFTVLLNLLKLGLWDVGNTLQLPFWLDIVFSLIAIVLIVTVARNLWIGGGG